jgi:hypothetical protein
MSQRSALPFTLRRTESIVDDEWISTTEHVHGLLRVDGDRLAIQWRRSRSTERAGMTTMRTDREMEPVREVFIPLDALAGATTRWVWWRWPPGLHLVLTAADLLAFEDVAGASGLRLDHPAELLLRVGRADHAAAREFAGELELTMADRALRAAEQESGLEPGSSNLLGTPQPGPPPG